MAYIPDTSVILRLNEPGNPLCKIVQESLEKLLQNGEVLVLVPQILVEFWVVATRPKSVNGLGLTIDEAKAEIENLQKVFILLPENEQIFDKWQTLVFNHKVSGKVAHDARIVAAMIVHKIENILTLNPGDFQRFSEIKAVKPQDV
jgi:predicted nucleic acid-binding protein